MSVENNNVFSTNNGQFQNASGLAGRNLRFHFFRSALEPIVEGPESPLIKVINDVRDLINITNTGTADSTPPASPPRKLKLTIPSRSPGDGTTVTSPLISFISGRLSPAYDPKSPVVNSMWQIIRSRLGFANNDTKPKSPVSPQDVIESTLDSGSPRTDNVSGLVSPSLVATKVIGDSTTATSPRRKLKLTIPSRSAGEGTSVTSPLLSVISGTLSPVTGASSPVVNSMWQIIRSRLGFAGQNAEPQSPACHPDLRRSALNNDRLDRNNVKGRLSPGLVAAKVIGGERTVLDFRTPSPTCFTQLTGGNLQQWF